MDILRASTMHCGLIQRETGCESTTRRSDKLSLSSTHSQNFATQSGKFWLE
jgi:hypothetical protein